MKFIPKLPVRVPVRPKELLTALQTQWLNSRYNEGRDVCVIIGTKRARNYEGVILRHRDWDFDIPPKEFEKLIVPVEDIVNFILSRVKKQ